MAERRSKINRILKSRFFIIFITVCLALFLFGFIKTFWRDWQIRKEIADLETTRAQLEQKKIKILDYLKEAGGTDYAERQARINFGLIRPGETAVIINDATKTVSSTERSKMGTAGVVEEPSNLKQWWYYFFK